MGFVVGGGMRGGRLAILVLLFAVFSMHGAQYVSAGVHEPVASTADHALDAAAVTGLVLGPVTLAEDAGMAMAPKPTAAASGAAGTMPGHSLPAHVWSLCLAVLLAGFALFGAALAWRTGAPPLSQSLSRFGSTVLKSRPPRPPDLSVLCLLRI